MGPSDDRKDSPNPLEKHLSVGNELLYGWLVGRAAADLGLAQALASSDAHYGERIKRMEESLVTQIQELKNNQLSSRDTNANVAELDAIKLTIERLSERQEQVALAQAKLDQLEATVRAKLGEFESQIALPPEGFPGDDLNDFKFELKLLADRVARAEFFTQQGQSSRENTQVEELVASRVKQESAAIKSQLVAELGRQPPAELITETVDALLQKKFDDVGLEQLQAQMITLGEALSQLKNTRDNDQQLEAQRREWARGIEAIIATRLTALNQQWSERIGTYEKSVVDREHLQIEVGALIERVEQMELAYRQTQSNGSTELQQVATDLRREMEEFKAELSHHAERASQALIHALEGSVNAKIGELLSALARDRENDQRRDAQLSELQREIRALAERLVRAESSAQQTHALMVNETAQSAQLRDGMNQELTTLQTQLAETQAQGAKIDSMVEQLNARLLELQNQLNQKFAMLAGREADIGDLKIQVQKLIATNATQSGALAKTVNRLDAPIGVAVELSGMKSPEKGVPMVKPDTAANQANTLLQSYDAGARGPTEHEKLLQQRISADIERVRAELRKRAGMSR